MTTSTESINVFSYDVPILPPSPLILTVSTSGGIILDVPVILGSAGVHFSVANGVDAIQVGRTTLSQVDASDLGGVGDGPINKNWLVEKHCNG